MINLLPIEEKKKIHRKYIFRLLTVALGAIFVTAVIGIVTLLPSYFISDLEKRAAVEEIERIRGLNGDDDQDNIASALKDAQQKLEILSPESKKVSVRTIFDTAIAYKSKRINLTGLAFQKESDGELRFTVNGIADRREDLLGFTQKLEQDELFDDVELPVSHLAQDRDINFILTISGAF